MRRCQRFVSAAVLIALSSALTGCGSMGTGFDPSDLLDFLDTKKKLPGERKPVFPEGVPGLQQGVPKELYRGNVEQQQQQQDNVAVAPPPAEPPKQRAKSKGRVSVGAVRSAAPASEAAPADAEVAPAEDTSGAPPAPKGRIVRRRTTAPPPDSSSAAPAAQQAQPATTPFPAPVPSGTFTR